MWRASASATVFLLLASALASPLLYAQVAADPAPIDNLDGTSDVVWSFSSPANYTLSNTQVAGGQSSLRPQISWWNNTASADFAGPDSATNVDLATWPGNVALASTSGPSTLVTIQPGPAAGLDAYLDRGNPTLNHGGDMTLVFDPRASTTRRPILQFSLASIPAGAVIDDAKLSLYMSATAANPSAAEILAVIQAWQETQVTWNDRLTGMPWATLGGDYDAHVADLLTLGSVADDQATSGTLTLAYATAPDVVQVDFAFFDGSWTPIGSDLAIDGSYLWTPSGPINGVTIRAIAVDEVNLSATSQRIGVGTRTVGANPPSLASIPTVHVQAGAPYSLNLTFYLSDPDTPLSGLTIWNADSANVSVLPDASPSLTIAYATIGTYVVTVWASDGTDTAWTLLTVVAEPTSPPIVISAPPPVVFDEDMTALNGFGATATTYINDPDGDPLSFAVLGNPSIRVRVNPGNSLDFWADPNWFGSETLRLRGTDPTGGFAEAAFRVVVRSLNDPPVLAAPPSITVEAGTRYVLDLDAYISDVDTPLTAITVTTDSPYVTVSGHNLTLAFPSDWTNAEFNVTASDGSAVTVGTVRVRFHITPPWWQAPYVLAMPPIGVILVVAMFAQRARWKPAKAFLVDERGRMVREFTFDPSCQVTYDQAVKEGILDAVEKPIKVTKYHGQTVRGDALAVVLLTYGPVTSEHIEFAREMLVQIQDRFEDAVKQRLAEARAQESNLASRTKALEERHSAIETRAAEIDSMLREVETAQSKIATDTAGLDAKEHDLEEREAVLAHGQVEIEASRRALETGRQELEEMRRRSEATFREVKTLEEVTLAKSTELHEREARIAPAESRVSERTKLLDARESELASQGEAMSAKASDLDTMARELGDREAALHEDRVVFQEARAALESERREFQERTAQREDEFRRRQADLDAQAKTVGEQQLRLIQAKQTFEAARTEKDHAILSREIEIEAREQSLRDKEEAVRTQAEENARHFVELTAREESLEIEGAKLDKSRVELDTRKAELVSLAKELDGKAAHLRDEEARRAEELRTWQTTLESEQALLKEQRETFEQEASSSRASWADRIMRVERREVDLEEKEEKIRSDMESIARNDAGLKVREQAAEEAAKSALQIKAEVERLQKETEQRFLEVESRERAVREEAARHAFELTKQTEALKGLEKEFEARQSNLEKEHVAKAQRLHEIEAELQNSAQALETKARELADRETRIAALEESLRQEAHRLQREHADVQATVKQVESRQLELAQLKDRYESEAASVRSEAETTRNSLAAKEAELRAQRERIERDSSALQDTLGAKAKEMASREKALTAREVEIRAKELDLETRMRELESKGRQTEARMTELSAQATALIRREQDLEARAGQLDQTARRFESEAMEKRREWESLQAALRSQQAQLNATAESRLTELAKRTEEIEGRDRTLQANFAQLELERSKLETQAKAQAAKAADVEAARQRSDVRFAELTAKEDELLRARQSFESERSAWSGRRAEELKQLESTRDAAAEQAQQAERLVAESQRRALLAGEAERAASRQAANLASQQALLEKRLSEAEKAEHDAQAHLVQLQEASRKLAVKDMEIAAALKDLETRQSKLAGSERDAATLAAELRTKKTSLDQEDMRLATLTEQLTSRQREIESRAAAYEAKSAQVVTKEQTLATELQRADNLMEDLTKKERDLRARDEAVKAAETGLAKREATLAARDTQLAEGMRSLEKMRQEIENQRAGIEGDVRNAKTARAEAEALKREAEKLRAQADTAQAEVAKNLRFLQKKALDVLDQEERLRVRATNLEEGEKALDGRGEVLEGKERALQEDQAAIDSKIVKLQAEIDRLRARLADAEKAGGPSAAAMEEWKKDVENRVKIIQKKAMELLDREEKLRKKEEEIRALASQLGVTL